MGWDLGQEEGETMGLGDWESLAEPSPLEWAPVTNHQVQVLDTACVTATSWQPESWRVVSCNFRWTLESPALAHPPQKLLRRVRVWLLPCLPLLKSHPGASVGHNLALVQNPAAGASLMAQRVKNLPVVQETQNPTAARKFREKNLYLSKLSS